MIMNEFYTANKKQQRHKKLVGDRWVQKEGLNIDRVSVNQLHVPCTLPHSAPFWLRMVVQQTKFSIQTCVALPVIRSLLQISIYVY